MNLILLEQKVKKCSGEWKHRYLCFCGNEFLTYKNFITRGHTKSCGCLRIKNKHGHTTHSSVSATYNSWSNMLQRCTNPKNTNYHYYGGRGITVCSRWFDFSKFLIDMGTRPSGKTLDRINNDGNYEPENCKWSTAQQQISNRRKYKKRG